MTATRDFAAPHHPGGDGEQRAEAEIQAKPCGAARGQTDSPDGLRTDSNTPMWPNVLW